MGDLDRRVEATLVAAQEPPALLESMGPGRLMLAPGDRADVLMLAYASRQSETIPAVGGVLLSGGRWPDPSVLRFVQGVKEQALPLLVTDLDSYSTAAAIAGIASVAAMITRLPAARPSGPLAV